MTTFHKIVKAADAAADCLPFVSTVTNACHLIYGTAHKVNDSNPVKTSKLDDLKIHSLSKSKVLACCALVPVLGNIAALVIRVIHHIRRDQQGFLHMALSKSIAGEKHWHEVVRTYVARNPDLRKTEYEAAYNIYNECRDRNYQVTDQDRQTCECLVDSKKNWNKEDLMHVLRISQFPMCISYLLRPHSRLLEETDIFTLMQEMLRSDRGRLSDGWSLRVYLYYYKTKVSTNMSSEIKKKLIELTVDAIGENAIREESFLAVFETFPELKKDVNFLRAVIVRKNFDNRRSELDKILRENGFCTIALPLRPLPSAPKLKVKVLS